MEKAKANEIKRIINSGGKHYTTYYSAKKNELRVTIAEWMDGTTTDIEEFKRKKYAELLNTISSKEIRPKFRTETKRYQGFLNCFYIVFE